MTTRESADPRWRERLGLCGLAKLEALLGDFADTTSFAGQWEILGKPGLGGRRRWRWRLPEENGDSGDVLFVKRYSRTPLREQWDRILRQSVHQSRAYWEFAQSQRLAEAHVNVPAAVGFAERMVGAFERRSLVLLERAPGDAFDRVWTRLVEQNAPVTRGLARHDMARRLARFAAAFHGTGFCHRDLYLCHIFVDLDAECSRPPTFTLIDLARTHRPRWRRMRWIIKDLAQLDASARQIGASRADRWRFLLAYLNLQPRAPRARWYARRIARKSDWILRRIARKSRQT